jgi:hypothetical protein
MEHWALEDATSMEDATGMEDATELGGGGRKFHIHSFNNYELEFVKEMNTKLVRHVHPRELVLEPHTSEQKE